MRETHIQTDSVPAVAVVIIVRFVPHLTCLTAHLGSSVLVRIRSTLMNDWFGKKRCFATMDVLHWRENAESADAENPLSVKSARRSVSEFGYASTSSQLQDSYSNSVFVTTGVIAFLLLPLAEVQQWGIGRIPPRNRRTSFHIKADGSKPPSVHAQVITFLARRRTQNENDVAAPGHHHPNGHCVSIFWISFCVRPKTTRGHYRSGTPTDCAA